MSSEVFCNTCNDSGYVDGQPCVCFKVKRLAAYAPQCLLSYSQVSSVTKDALNKTEWKPGNTLIKITSSWGSSSDSLADKIRCIELYWLLVNGQKAWAEYGTGVFNQIIWKQYDDSNRFSTLNKPLVIIRYGLDEWDTGSVEDNVLHFLGQFRDAGCKVLFVATNAKPFMTKWGSFFVENKYNICDLGSSVAASGVYNSNITIPNKGYNK